MTPAEKASDYLRQCGRVRLAEKAREAIAAGDLALAYALVWGLHSCDLGNLKNACVDFARRELGKAWTPDLPSKTRARFEQWCRENP